MTAAAPNPAAPAQPPAPPAEEEYKWDYTPESTFEGPEPLVVTLIGDPGVGKTHAGMTFPRPMVVIDTEARARAVARKFRDVHIKIPKGWSDIKAGCLHAAKRFKPGTILIDSGSDIRDMIEEWVLAVAAAKGEKVHHKFHWALVYDELKEMLAFLRKKGWFVIFSARKGEIFENDLKTGKRDANGFVLDKLGYHSDFVMYLEKGTDGFVSGRVTKNGSKRIGCYNVIIPGDCCNFDGIIAEWNAPELPIFERVTSASLKADISGAPAAAIPPTTPTQAPAPNVSPALSPAPAAALPSLPFSSAPPAAATGSSPALPKSAPTTSLAATGGSSAAPIAASPSSGTIASPATAAHPTQREPAGEPHFATVEEVAAMEALAAKLGTKQDDLWTYLKGEKWVDEQGRIPLGKYRGVMASMQMTVGAMEDQAAARATEKWEATAEDKREFSRLGVAAALTPEEMKTFPKSILGRDLKSWSGISREEFGKMCAALQARIDAKAAMVASTPPSPAPSAPAAPSTPPAQPSTTPASAVAPANSAPSTATIGAATGAAVAPPAPSAPAATLPSAVTDPRVDFVDLLSSPEAFGIAKTIEKPAEPITDAPTLIRYARTWAKLLGTGRLEEAKKAYAPLAGAGYLPITGVALADDIVAIEDLYRGLGMSLEVGWSKAVEKKLAVSPRRVSQAQAKVLRASLSKALEQKNAAAPK